MNLQEKIAKAQEQFEQLKPAEVLVEVGGEPTTIVFRPIWGDRWAALLAIHPALPGSDDEGIGYNADAVAADYPLDSVTVDGEPVDEDSWKAMLKVLTGPSRRRIATQLYGLNHVEPLKRLADAAGKAQKG